MKRLNMRICFTCKKIILVVEDEFDYDKGHKLDNFPTPLHSEMLDVKCDECHNNLYLLQTKQNMVSYYITESICPYNRICEAGLKEISVKDFRIVDKNLWGSFWKAAYNGEKFTHPKNLSRKVIKDPSMKANLKGLMKQQIAVSKDLRKDIIKPSNLTFKKSEIGDHEVVVIKKTKFERRKII